MKQVADEMGVGDTFRMTPVGVYFGAGAGVTEADPFFGGVGPERAGCTECGECMTGCRHNAKNTLPKNYLGLAERAGAEVFPLTMVVGQPGGRWGALARCRQAHRSARRSAGVHRRPGHHRRRHLQHPEVAAADEGARDSAQALGPARVSLADQLRVAGRCRGATTGEDYTEGVAITSSFYPEPHTHIEPVRYGRVRTRWVCSRRSSPTRSLVSRGGRPGLQPSRRTLARQPPCERAQVVRARRDRAGDAEPRQLGDRLGQEDDHRPREV